MIEIPLSQGLTAIVDDEDAWVLEYSWQVWNAKEGLFYAVRSTSRKLGGKRTTVKLHRQILNPPKGVFVDHINGNGLDNRRSNLRLASNAENCRNQKVRKNNKSGFKGVYWKKTNQKWVAAVSLNGRSKHIGLFDTPEAAAAAYDKAASELYSSFARTNEKISSGK